MFFNFSCELEITPYKNFCKYSHYDGSLRTCRIDVAKKKIRSISRVVPMLHGHSQMGPLYKPHVHGHSQIGPLYKPHVHGHSQIGPLYKLHVHGKKVN